MKDFRKKLLLKSIKEQAKLFLEEIGSFYPFGCAIDKLNKVNPLGAYLEGENPPVAELIDLLEKVIDQQLKSGEYVIAATAIDVAINENNARYDAIEVRIFENNKEQTKEHIKYEIKEGHVKFCDQ